MYKVLLVDDEYMVTEGLKRLIPFDKWDMEVVATASHADEALEYVQESYQMPPISCFQVIRNLIT